MMRWLLLLFLLASPAMAQSVPLRSGEHESFTRLVFALTSRTSWSIDRPEQSVVEISFATSLPQLDLSGVFDRIPKTRLTAVTPLREGLRLDLACPCAVTVTQIQSGHIVIDIDDRLVATTEELEPAPTRNAILPLRLQPLAWPVPAAFTTATKLEEGPRSGPRFDPVDNRPSQLRRYPSGLIPLLPREPNVAPPARPACTLEILAADILMSDASAALEHLGPARSAVLDAKDRSTNDGVRDLAFTYLKIGWGAEARSILHASNQLSDDLDLLTQALDGIAMNHEPDPGCGPASALLSLLGSPDQVNWGRADETAFLGFLDNLPAQKLDLFWPDLSRALATLGRENLLNALRPPGDIAPPADHYSIAAGTDLAAVEATLRKLQGTNAEGAAPDLATLENAGALRPAVPEGDLRDALDIAMAQAFVLNRNPQEAVGMVKAGRIDASKVLVWAIDNLEPSVAAEFAIRLHPELARDRPARARARTLFEGLGLPQTAGRFADPSEPTGPALLENDERPADPWLQRDLGAILAASGDDPSPRAQMAALILRRNTVPTPATDLASAEAALSESREISALVRRLVDEP